MSSKEKTIRGHWEKRKKGLVKPYIWLSIIFLALDLIFVIFQVQNIKIFFRDLYKTLCLRGIGTLWFLPALLGGEMLFLSIRKLNAKLRTGSYFVCLILIYSFYLWGECEFIDNRDLRDIVHAPMRVIKDVCDAVIYISVAFYSARKLGKVIMSQDKWKLFIQGACLLLLSFIIMNNLPSYLPSFTISFILGNICSGFGILFFFTSIETFGIVAKPLEYFGKNSLIVMAFHFCLLFQIVLAFDRTILHHTSYSGGITLIYFAIAIIAQIILIELINRKFKFIIGKD